MDLATLILVLTVVRQDVTAQKRILGILGDIVDTVLFGTSSNDYDYSYGEDYDYEYSTEEDYNYDSSNGNGVNSNDASTTIQNTIHVTPQQPIPSSIPPEPIVPALPTPPIQPSPIPTIQPWPWVPPGPAPPIASPSTPWQQPSRPDIAAGDNGWMQHPQNVPASQIPPTPGMITRPQVIPVPHIHFTVPLPASAVHPTVPNAIQNPSHQYFSIGKERRSQGRQDRCNKLARTMGLCNVEKINKKGNYGNDDHRHGSKHGQDIHKNGNYRTKSTYFPNLSFEPSKARKVMATYSLGNDIDNLVPKMNSNAYATNRFGNKEEDQLCVDLDFSDMFSRRNNKYSQTVCMRADGVKYVVDYDKFNVYQGPVKEKREYGGTPVGTKYIENDWSTSGGGGESYHAENYPGNGLAYNKFKNGNKPQIYTDYTSGGMYKENNNGAEKKLVFILGDDDPDMEYKKKANVANNDGGGERQMAMADIHYGGEKWKGFVHVDDDIITRKAKKDDDDDFLDRTDTDNYHLWDIG